MRTILSLMVVETNIRPKEADICTLHIKLKLDSSL